MSGRAGDQPRGRYRHGVVRWVAAGVIVLALVAAVLPSFGAVPSDADGDADTAAPVPAPPSSPASSPPPSPPAGSSTATSVAPAPTTSGDVTPPVTDSDVPSLYGLISDDPQFSSVENAIEAAGLFDDLENGGPFTLFAPSNDAFEALDPAFAGALNADPRLHEDILFHHALAGIHDSRELREGSIEMVDGSSVEIDIGPDGITLVSGVTAATVTDADLAASNGVLHVVDGILIPPGIDAVVDDDAAVSVSVAAGGVVLTGAVGDAAQRARLREAVEEAVDPASVDDRLVVDPAAAAGDARLDDLAAVGGLLPIEFVDGDARLAGEAIAVGGVVVDDAARRRLENLAAELTTTVLPISGAARPLRNLAREVDTDVLLDLERRPTADSLLARTISAEIERLLAAKPLRFVSGVRFADPSAGATLDRVAGLVKAADGLVVAIVGFTDTGGNAATNLRISLLRAEAVENELVRRGVPADDLATAGFGETAPVLVDGVEDAAASRRVEVAVRLSEPTP